MIEEKQFNEWNEIKKMMHRSNRIQAMKEGEIWWCAMGENVGIEINGKSATFARPVLIFKKLSRFGFLGIPLTSQEHEGDWYIPFIFRNKKQIAVIAQVRVMSVFRLYTKIGILSNSDFSIIKIRFGRLYLGL